MAYPSPFLYALLYVPASLGAPAHSSRRARRIKHIQRYLTNNRTVLETISSATPASVDSVKTTANSSLSSTVQGITSSSVNASAAVYTSLSSNVNSWASDSYDTPVYNYLWNQAPPPSVPATSQPFKPSSLDLDWTTSINNYALPLQTLPPGPVSSSCSDTFDPRKPAPPTAAPKPASQVQPTSSPCPPTSSATIFSPSSNAFSSATYLSSSHTPPPPVPPLVSLAYASASSPSFPSPDNSTTPNAASFAAHQPLIIGLLCGLGGLALVIVLCRLLSFTHLCGWGFSRRYRLKHGRGIEGGPGIPPSAYKRAVSTTTTTITTDDGEGEDDEKDMSDIFSAYTRDSTSEDHHKDMIDRESVFSQVILRDQEAVEGDVDWDALSVPPEEDGGGLPGLDFFVTPPTPSASVPTMRQKRDTFGHLTPYMLYSPTFSDSPLLSPGEGEEYVSSFGDWIDSETPAPAGFAHDNDHAHPSHPAMTTNLLRPLPKSTVTVIDFSIRDDNEEEDDTMFPPLTDIPLEDSKDFDKAISDTTTTIVRVPTDRRAAMTIMTTLTSSPSDNPFATPTLPASSDAYYALSCPTDDESPLSAATAAAAECEFDSEWYAYDDETGLIVNEHGDKRESGESMSYCYDGKCTRRSTKSAASMYSREGVGDEVELIHHQQALREDGPPYQGWF